MNHSPFISVIIPVYNTEQYLEKCIDSILNQSFQNFEIILINDGSTDRSESICKQFAVRDDRIVFLSQSNRGLSEARNIGLNIARGVYVTGIDSDDRVMPDYLITLYETAIQYSADIIVSEFLIEEQGTIFPSKYSNKKVIPYNREEALTALFMNREIRDHFCAKLFRKELFEGIRFPVDRYFEDIFIMYRLFAKAQMVVKINHASYCYVQQPHSILHSPYLYEKKLQDWCNALEEQTSFIKEKEKNFSQIKKIHAGILRQFSHVKRELLRHLHEDSPNRQQLLKRVNQHISEELQRTTPCDTGVIKYSGYWLLLHCPQLFTLSFHRRKK